MTLSSISDLEGRSQNDSLVSSLQSRVAELDRYLAVCKEKLETANVRLKKCLTVGKELLIEKVRNSMYGCEVGHCCTFRA